MKVISLQSGSNGNCFYVESGDVKLLFDAGISGKVAQARLAEHGRDIHDVDALFISHDHSDHVRCLGVFNRKFGLPVFVTKATLRAADKWNKLGKLSEVNHFEAGQSISFGTSGLTVQQGRQQLFAFESDFGEDDINARFAHKKERVVVHTIPTPHDSVDGVVFVVESSSGHRVGILTDLGHVFKGLKEVLKSLDAVVIESNYDEKMLDEGRYPEGLKRRIAGRGGHLSNLEAAEVLRKYKSSRLKWACLCHLSNDNNEPRVAVQTHQRILGKEFPIHVASRDGVSPVLEI